MFALILIRMNHSRMAHDHSLNQVYAGCSFWVAMSDRSYYAKQIMLDKYQRSPRVMFKYFIYVYIVINMDSPGSYFWFPDSKWRLLLVSTKNTT